MLHHTGGTASLWTDVVPADTQLAMHGYWNSPSCHPVQFNLMVLCLTQTLCLICCLPTYLNAGQQRSRSHQSRQPSMLDYILLFAIRNTNLKIGASTVCFFFSFISLQQNTIDVSTCNAYFHGHGITKGHNSRFSVSQTVHLGIHSWQQLGRVQTATLQVTTETELF